MDVRLYLRRGDPHRGFVRTGEWWPKADDALRGPGGEAERTGELMLRARAAALLPRGPGARLAPRAWTPAAPALSPSVSAARWCDIRERRPRWSVAITGRRSCLSG
jgi:hypothetical protein